MTLDRNVRFDRAETQGYTFLTSIMADKLTLSQKKSGKWSGRKFYITDLFFDLNVHESIIR